MRLLLTTLLAVSALADAQAASLALVGAKVYPSPDAAPVENATVLIRDGVITRIGADVAVPAGVEVIDGRGDVVVAGFWGGSMLFLWPWESASAALGVAPLVIAAVCVQVVSPWASTRSAPVQTRPAVVRAMPVRRRRQPV